MVDRAAVDWPTCEEDGCIGVRLAAATSCLAHANPQERDAALKQFGETGSIDARGVPVTQALLEQLLEPLLASRPDDANEHRMFRTIDFEQATFEGDIRFAGVIFKAWARFTTTTFKGGASFTQATFEGGAQFDQATFNGEARFDQATFNGEAWFIKSTFKGETQFGGATFKDRAEFTETTFQHDAYFDGAAFQRDTWFQRAAFQLDSRFTGATFHGEAWFKEITFARRAGFSRARFKDRAVFRAVTVKDKALFMDTAFEGQAGFSGATFKDEALFNRATFTGWARFAGGRFEDKDEPFSEKILKADLEPATFEGGAQFDGVTFKREAWFDGVTFKSIAQFSGATFQGEAGFDRASFEGRALFDKARLQGTAGFHGATFEDVAWFEEATFKGTARFERATFEGTARFDMAKFEAEGTAAFADAMFKDRTWFDGAAFRGEVKFDGTTFEGKASFDRATFRRQAAFDDARFGDGTTFLGAELHDGADLSGARFGDGAALGPLALLGSLVLDRTAFANAPAIAVSGGRISLVGLRAPDGILIQARWSDIVLERPDFGRPSVIAGVPPFSDLDEKDAISQATAAGDATRTALPRVNSLRGCDVRNLVLSDVDLRACRFAGAYNLDQLGIEGWSFTSCPKGLRHGRWPMLWAWTHRRVLAEEHEWRATYERGTRRKGWAPPESQSELSEQLMPQPGIAGPANRHTQARELAAIYRSLRKGREDAKDEPGAADFYYGEMEMRRHAAPKLSVERAVLTLYWLVAGYALRAWRALAALALVLPLAAWLLAHRHGFADPQAMTFWGALRYSGRTAIGLLPRDQPTLTSWGDVLQIAVRVVVPVLLGLAILSIRGRVKR